MSRSCFHRLMSAIVACVVLSGPVPTWAEDPEQETKPGEVNLYSALPEEVIQPALDVFSEKSGIKVNLFTDSPEALLQRLVEEGKEGPADVLITTSAAHLQAAVHAGLLKSVASQTLQKLLPNILRGEVMNWFGITQRARPLLYAKDRVKHSELSTYEGLADPKWKGRLCLSGAAVEDNRSLVAAFLHATDPGATEKWISGLLGNLASPPAGSDTDQLRVIAAGRCDVTIAGTTAFARLSTSTPQEKTPVAGNIGVFWPNQDRKDRGYHVNVNGVGLLRSSRNRKQAWSLLNSLFSRQSQEALSLQTLEYPVRRRVKTAPGLPTPGLKTDSTPLWQLGDLDEAAAELMQKAGWK